MQTEEAAFKALKEVQLEFSDARHHCWAFLLHEGERSRSSDDGEPGGSAGRPILAQLVGHELSDLMVVVTRYFGGTKLGVGGLIRAYGGCAGKGLDQAARVEVVETEDLVEAGDFRERLLAERSLALERMQAIPLEKIAKGDVERLSKPLHDHQEGAGSESVSRSCQ